MSELETFKPPDNEAIPEELNERYSDFIAIGAGGMGQVFAARDTLLDKQVAIKLLPNKNASPQAILRFQQEARAASRLKHDSIVAVMDFGYTENGTPYLVMEFVKGEDLESIVKRHGVLPMEKVLDIALALCDALGHAHSQGVIHRDIKPSNVMMDECGKVRILDFGAARILFDQSDWRLTNHGHPIGTLLYMSPEQIRGEETDERTDIYALGLLIYKLNTDRVHCQNDNIMQFIKHRLASPPPAIPEQDSEARQDTHLRIKLNEVLAKALAIAPEERFATMLEFKNALLEAREEWQKSKLEEATEPISQANRRRFINKLEFVRVMIILLAIASFCVYAAYTTWIEKTKPTNSVVEQPLKTETLGALARVDTNLPRGFTKRKGEAHPGPSGRDHAARVMAEDSKDEDLLRLRNTDISRLSLENNRQITKDGIRIISRLPLIELNLRDTRLGDECIDEINKISTLQDLDLRNTNFTQAGVLRLKPSKEVLALHLGHMRSLDDRGLAYIARSFPNLTHLDLAETSITSNGIKCLRNLALSYLSLGDTGIGDDDISFILSLGVRHLDLASTKITDRCLGTLSQDDKLEWIGFEHCPGVSQTAVERLHARRPDLAIQNINTPAPPDDLMELYEKD